MRICLAIATAATALTLAPTAQAQNIKFYEIASASGTYDHQARYISPSTPECPGSFEYEEHSEFPLLRSKDSGGTLFNRRGPLVVAVGGGYDGVYRELDCSGQPKSSCEHHFGWRDDGVVTLNFRSRGRVIAVLSSAQPRTDDCPLIGKNGFYLGRDRVSRSDLRSNRFRLRFRRNEEAAHSSGGAIGSLVSDFTVLVRRTRG